MQILRNLAKAALTVGAFWLLLTHEVTDASGARISAWSAISGFLPRIDLTTFVQFTALAAAIKLVGILSSMWRWTILLRGQGIELPFRHIFGAFLTGRFLGTFLPSTIGLDAYKLWDAARFSGRSVEASAATGVEKTIGPTGIFLSYLVALPFGISIFGERAATIAALTIPLALAPLLLCVLLFLWPGPRVIEAGFTAVRHRLPLGALDGFVARLVRGATAYQGRPGVVLAALGLSFVVHFTTAAMYFFTALAIGVSAASASFWQVTFASSIQILATVLSPFTIAGAGIREIAQFYLLGHLMGPAESIVSAALGFWAAEGLTLFGGIFWWVRGPSYRPQWCRVDGRQVDWDAAALAARDLGFVEPTSSGASAGEALGWRLARGAGVGLLGGVAAGVVLGAADAGVTLRLAGPGDDAQVAWFAIALYGSVCAALGLLLGGSVGLLPFAARALERCGLVVAFLGAAVPLGLAATMFRLQRDAFAEQRPPLLVLLAAAGVVVVVGLLLAWLLDRLHCRHAGERGGLRAALRALGLWAVALGLGYGVSVARAPAAVPAAAVRSEVPAALRDRPNVILIIVDTLRADHVGPAGGLYGGRGLTPRLDALTAAGSRYLAFGQASWTKPAVASIFTSLFPSSHGAMSKPSVLPEGVPTIAEALRAAGFTTAGFVSNINLAPSFGFDQGFDEYEYLAPDYLFGARESSSKLVLYSILRKIVLGSTKRRVVNQYYQDSRTVNSHVIPWLERHRDDRFFLLIHYMDPHDPYFRHPYDGEAIARVENPNPPAALAERMRELYAGEVRHLDESIGMLGDALARLGLLDQTAIVLTADHGEEFHEHGGWWHGTTLYDEQIHVPLVVRWPRGVAAPADSSGQARQIDIAPTIAALAGVPTDAAWQGSDVRLGIPGDRAVFAEEDHEGNVLSAIRTPSRKLIRANPGNPRGLRPEELYDVASDPGERKDLAATDAAEVSRLTSELDGLARIAAGHAVAPGGDVKMDAATTERLRALGYVE